MGSGVPRFFVYFTSNGYTADGDWQGGYTWDLTPGDGGWHQSSTTHFPGVYFTSFSVTNGTQLVFELNWFDDTNNWWLWTAGEWIGYVPKCKHESCSATNPTVFSSSGILDHASGAEFYGEVYDHHAPSATTTDMGSGKKASQGYKKAAYFKSVLVRSTTATTYSDIAGANGAVFTTTEDTSCYTISASADASTRLFYGGGGDQESGCN
jgi:hypothetical protein